METSILKISDREPPAESHAKHIPELDGIRGWACFSVLVAHCITGIMQPATGSALAKFQSATLHTFLGGVDLFFVLSGFLIGGILIDSKGKRNYFSNFWIRRIGRIFPVAYLLIATYCVFLFGTSYFGTTRFDQWLLDEPKPPIWTFLTFTQSIPIAWGGYGGPKWMGITWSLAIEEQFYIVFPFLVYFLSRRALACVVVGGLFFGPIMRHVLLKAFGDWYAPYVLLPSRVDALMYGVAVALIIRNARAMSLAKYYQPALDVIGLYILYRMSFDKIASWPLLYSAMAAMWAIVILRIFTVQNSIFNKVWLSKTLARGGLISYALYMYHQAVNGLMHQLILKQDPQVTNLREFLVSLGVVGISIGLATLSYKYFESPIRKFSQNLAKKTEIRDSAPPLDAVSRAKAA